jgi:hypothetical protein
LTFAKLSLSLDFPKFSIWNIVFSAEPTALIFVAGLLAHRARNNSLRPCLL